MAADATGVLVRQARHDARLTEKELARRLGVRLWTIERIERGLESPQAYLPAIARETGRPEDWFSHSPLTRKPAAATEAREGTATGAGAGTTIVLASLTLLIVIRVFTELLGVLPRAANFIDIPIFITLVAAAAVSPPASARSRTFTPALVLAFGFLLMFTVATMTNLTRVSLAPALMFLYGFLGPVGVCFAVHRLWVPGSAVRLSRLLVALCLLQLVLALGVQLPEYLDERNPDVITGTFGENAYQLVFFLVVMLALLVGIFTFEKARLVARVVPLLLIAVVAVILLAQYRALLITTVLTIVLVSVLLGSARGRGALIGVFAAAGLVLSLAFVAQSVPELKFGSVIEQSREDPTVFIKKRFGAGSSIGRLYDDEPRFALTGTGPGTYSSRAWQTFARAGTSRSQSNVAGEYVNALTNGKPYRTDVSEKYVVPQLRGGEIVDGSRALSSPYASYLSVLAEVGVVGFALIVGLYLWAFVANLRMALVSARRATDGDPLPALLCASTVAFFVLLQMAMLENWFEVTRITFLSWILFAVAAKEFESRRA